MLGILPPTPLLCTAPISRDQILFKLEIAIDLLWIEGVPITDIVDKRTVFQNASSLGRKTPQDI